MSTRRHRIVHRTTMHYDREVTASHNELRMIPVDEPGQTTLEARVRVKPLTWSNGYVDHWGTHVMSLESRTPHRELEIEATSTVERSDTPEGEPAGWEAVRAERVQDRLSEFLAQTARTAPHEEVVALAEEVATAATPREAARSFGDRIQGTLAYERGITGWQPTAQAVWEARRGVCQDFAHLTLGGLRHIDIPARYVAGYRTAKDTGESGLARGASIAGRNHAWLEFWDGEWLPLDPTDVGSVGLDHVVIGRGRDYDDVSPFRGMYVGPERSELSIDITYTRVG